MTPSLKARIMKVFSGGSDSMDADPRPLVEALSECVDALALWREATSTQSAYHASAVKIQMFRALFKFEYVLAQFEGEKNV